MSAELISIKLIKPNPKNPRFIRDYKYKELLESLRTSFWMMEARPIVVDENMVVLGGNQRLRACQELKYKEVWFEDGSKWTKEQQAEFIIKDNTHYGEWDYDMLANEWDQKELQAWGMDGFPFDANGEDQYTNKIKAPLYKPENDKPEIDTIITNTKVNKLLEEINNSTLINEQKEFLKICAFRHYVFDYTKIADLYANSENEMQDLMEKSALIIIDFDKAIENGFVEMSDQIAKTYG